MPPKNAEAAAIMNAAKTKITLNQVKSYTTNAKVMLAEGSFDGAIAQLKRAQKACKGVDADTEAEVEKLLADANTMKDTKTVSDLKAVADKSLAGEWFMAAMNEYTTAVEVAEDSGLVPALLRDLQELKTTTGRRLEQWEAAQKELKDTEVARIRKEKEDARQASLKAAAEVEAARIAKEEEAARVTHEKWINSTEYKLEQQMLALQQVTAMSNGEKPDEKIKRLKKEQMKKLFAQVDDDGNGILDANEIGGLCKKLGMKLTPGELAVLLKEIDTPAGATRSRQTGRPMSQLSPINGPPHSQW